MSGVEESLEALRRLTLLLFLLGTGVLLTLNWMRRSVERIEKHLTEGEEP